MQMSLPLEGAAHRATAISNKKTRYILDRYISSGYISSHNDYGCTFIQPRTVVAPNASSVSYPPCPGRWRAARLCHHAGIIQQHERTSPHGAWNALRHD